MIRNRLKINTVNHTNIGVDVTESPMHTCFPSP